MFTPSEISENSYTVTIIYS